MERKSIIEVNGKRYDAVTGTVLGPASAPTVHSSGRNIDGFFRARPTVAQKELEQTPPPITDFISTTITTSIPRPAPHSRSSRAVNHAKPHAPQAAVPRAIRISQDTTAPAHTFAVRREQGNHTHHHTTQRSETLRRDAVPQPRLSAHNLLKPKSSLQYAEPNMLAPKTSASDIDSERLMRAQNIERSPLVAHHVPHQAHQTVVPTIAPLAVRQAPVNPRENTPPTVPSPQPTNGPDDKRDDIFMKALADATHFVDIHAHRTAYRKKVRTHMVSMAAGTLAFVIIAGFAAYQNTPGLQLKIASFRAGVSTPMPNFQAAGFAYSGVRAGNGRLTLGFTGRGGDNYQLTQTNTDLSDADMIQTIGATYASGKPIYSVMFAGNTTVYRFSNTNATWVSNGKWYTITGTGALTDAQVKSLVQHV